MVTHKQTCLEHGDRVGRKICMEKLKYFISKLYPHSKVVVLKNYSASFERCFELEFFRILTLDPNENTWRTRTNKELTELLEGLTVW